MTFRVTNETQLAQAQQNLQASQSRLSQLTNEASTGLAIQLPSDDPAGTGQLMQFNQELAQNTQYQANATNGIGWLTTVSSALSSVVTSLTQVSNLTVQAANGTNSSQSESAIIDQLNGIKQNLMAEANTQYLGMNVFAGTSTASTAFNADYSYNGTPGATAQRRVGPDTTIPVSADGSAVFGTGSNSVFALIDSITSALTSGSSVSSQLTAIGSALSNVEGIEATVGANQQQLQQAQTALQTQATTIQTNQSAVQNADPAQVILAMQSQQVAYETALAATAQSLQPTLMDYLEQ